MSLNKIAVTAALTFTVLASRADDFVTSTNVTEVSSRPSYQPFTVDAEIGTTGFGGGANWRFLDNIGIGGACDYFPYNYSGTIEGIDFDSRLRLLSEPVTLNWYPWRNHSFHLSVGALFNENEITGSKTGTVNLDGTTYTGTVSMKIQQQVVDPYVSLGGSLYFDRGHHFALNGEIGVFYTGEPRVSLSTPGAPDSDVQGEQNNIKHYARDAEFWPVLKLSLSYSF